MQRNKFCIIPFVPSSREGNFYLWEWKLELCFLRQGRYCLGRSRRKPFGLARNVLHLNLHGGYVTSSDQGLGCFLGILSAGRGQGSRGAGAAGLSGAPGHGARRSISAHGPVNGSVSAAVLHQGLWSEAPGAKPLLVAPCEQVKLD